MERVARMELQSRVVVFVMVLGFGIGLVMSGTSKWPAVAGGCIQVADYVGSDEPDIVSDTPGWARTFRTHGAQDLVEARDCRDDIYGQAGPDELHGAAFSDLVVGGDGSDGKGSGPFGGGVLLGGDGDDRIEGNNDADVLDDTAAGADEDLLFGGTGNDDLWARDGDGRDVLDGDDGTFDRCQSFDTGDVTRSCIIQT
jgi:hypothetical protein